MNQGGMRLRRILWKQEPTRRDIADARWYQHKTGEVVMHGLEWVFLRPVGVQRANAGRAERKG